MFYLLRVSLANIKPVSQKKALKNQEACKYFLTTLYL